MSENEAPPEGQHEPSIYRDLDRLAMLSPAEYESVRRAEAKRLGWRPSVLDREIARARKELGLEEPAANGKPKAPPPFPVVEPWPEEVDGEALLDALAATFRRYVVLPEHAAEALALWVLLTYVHDHGRVSPILALVSPQPRCGKTTTLGLLAGLCYRPLPTSNVTAAVLFRAIDKWHPTLLIDEADSFLKDNEELRGVLNSGHVRATARTLRCVGDDSEPKPFTTWAPKAIAAIGRLHPTLTDRSVTVPMRRQRPDERRERLALGRLDTLGELASRCLRWAEDNGPLLEGHEPLLPNGLHDRAADNWEPLLAIAEVVRTAERMEAGTDWATKARAAAVGLSDVGTDDLTIPVQLLADIRDLFAARVADRLASADITQALADMEERPWPEWHRGKPITVRQVAKMLKPFDIAPKTIRTADGTPKGYELGEFTDAFARYLPPPSATPPQSANGAALRDFQSATPGGHVADEKAGKPARDKACCGVADETPPAGQVVRLRV